jgi:hypothetical protein
MKEAESIINNLTDFLNYLKSKFPLIHKSNFFFRDLHYGVMLYLDGGRGAKLKYSETEQIAKEVAEALEHNGIFRRIDHQTWLVNYPEFALPRAHKEEKKIT